MLPRPVACGTLASVNAPAWRRGLGAVDQSATSLTVIQSIGGARVEPVAPRRMMQTSLLLCDCIAAMNVAKSKQRGAHHGEVFRMVEAMLDLVKGESERVDSRVLQPACGSGNFLVPVLKRKIAAVEFKFGKSDFEKQYYALLAVMCTYGIELLTDNIAARRA